MSEKVSPSVIRRLPRYHRFLKELLQSNIQRISSRELSEKMRLTASQIRQDFNCFGEFGQQGYGYNVELLYTEIGRILGLEDAKTMIQIGVGNLGKAIVSHLDFSSCGFSLIGLFDQDPKLIGRKIAKLTIQDTTTLAAFCRQHHPTAAVLCIPEEAAQQLSKTLVESGVQCFWNFSHYDLALHYDDILVENVHITDSLMTLGYLASNPT